MITNRGSVLNKYRINNNLEDDFLNEDFANLELETVNQIVVDNVTQYRPDLISMKYLGTPHLGWLIAMHNGMQDMIFEFTIGKLIKIPNVMDYYKFHGAHNQEIEE